MGLTGNVGIYSFMSHTKIYASLSHQKKNLTVWKEQEMTSETLPAKAYLHRSGAHNSDVGPQK